MIGLLCHKIGMKNYLGPWAQARCLELDLSQNRLAADLGTRPSAISNVFDPNGRGPSFETALGPSLIERILAGERKALAGRGVGRYPRSRPRALRQAAAVLSLWDRSVKSATARPGALFDEIAPMLPPDAHRALCEIVFTAVTGPILRSDEVPARLRSSMAIQIYGRTRGHEAMLFRFRRWAGEELALFESGAGRDARLPDADRILDDDADSLFAAGRPREALGRILNRLDAAHETRVEAMERAI